MLQDSQGKTVHYFDLDQTKPLFRARDIFRFLTAAGVVCHSEPQLFDTPTQVGGVQAALNDDNCFTVLDIGGNEAGARLIGSYAPFFAKENTIVIYIVNVYRPWSKDIDALDYTLSSILRAARVSNFRMVGNPNIGPLTSEEDFLTGYIRTQDLLQKHINMEFFCIRDELYQNVKETCPSPLMPIVLHLTYPWGSVQIDDIK